MPTIEEVRDWTGAELVGHDGEKVGTISHIYLDRETGDPSFVSVKTGLFGMKSSLVPIAAASQHGDHIHVAFTKDEVKDAPNVDADEDLSPDEEQRLYSHYGMGYDVSDRDERTPANSDAGHVTSGPNARLRKYVITVRKEQIEVDGDAQHETSIRPGAPK
jgi:PRC-barrel domain